MSIKKHIPNIITLLNLFCGCIALVFVSKFDFLTAFFFVSLGIFFDFFDGFFARLFKVSSPLGLQLDSLADMVTSGVVPGFVMFQMLNQQKNIQKSDILSSFYEMPQTSWFAYIGFIITLGACFRLANFNIDTRQSNSFIGLPTPANTLFILSLPLISCCDLRTLDFGILILISISILSAFVMNAEIPLFSLKIKSYNLRDNKLPMFFLLIALFLIGFFQFLGVAITIVFYVALSVILNQIEKK
jgi:CDP-diacylglycerol---serine O-phosphatidyltransferase